MAVVQIPHPCGSPPVGMLNVTCDVVHCTLQMRTCDIIGLDLYWLVSGLRTHKPHLLCPSVWLWTSACNSLTYILNRTKLARYHTKLSTCAFSLRKKSSTHLPVEYRRGGSEAEWKYLGMEWRWTQAGRSWSCIILLEPITNASSQHSIWNVGQVSLLLTGSICQNSDV